MFFPDNQRHRPTFIGDVDEIVYDKSAVPDVAPLLQNLVSGPCVQPHGIIEVSCLCSQLSKKR